MNISDIIFLILVAPFVYATGVIIALFLLIWLFIAICTIKDMIVRKWNP